jgi:hypothetical protein
MKLFKLAEKKRQIQLGYITYRKNVKSKALRGVAAEIRQQRLSFIKSEFLKLTKTN